MGQNVGNNASGEVSRHLSEATGRYRLLIVDDEPGIRLLMRELLSDLYFVQVADGTEAALAAFQSSPFDIVLTDIRMPGRDGIALLRELRQLSPELPVIVVTAHADKSLAVKALKEGAFDLLDKPFEEIELLSAVKRATSQVMVQQAFAGALGSVQSQTADANPVRQGPTSQLIGIVGSFGAAGALGRLLANLPAGLPPLVAAIELGPGFSVPLAAKLQRACRFPVQELRDGEELQEGVVYLAPGGRTSTFSRNGTNYVAASAPNGFSDSPLGPMDQTLASLAEVAGERAIGIVLTGNHPEGASGLLAVRKAGGVTIVQGEASSAHFGLPRRAIELGAATHVAELPVMHTFLLDAVAGKSRT